MPPSDPGLPAIDGATHRSYCSDLERITDVDFTAKLMLVRAKSGIAIALLLTGILLLFGGARPALAHAGHDHGPAAHSVIQAFILGDTEQFVQAHEAPGSARYALAGVPAKPFLPLHQANCCCGSVACHAGVAAPHTNISDPYSCGERLALPPVTGLVNTASDGIDRPPRTQGSL